MRERVTSRSAMAAQRAPSARIRIAEAYPRVCPQFVGLSLRDRANSLVESYEGGGLLNADQHFGHRRFSSQIFALQSLPRSSDVAAVGSRGPGLGADRDNFRDSTCSG